MSIDTETLLLRQLSTVQDQLNALKRRELPVAAASDQLGTVYRRSLQEKAKDVRSIKDLGVRGDGGVSDSTLFHNAMHAAANENVTLYLPPNTQYNLTNMDQVLTDRPVRMFADDPESVTITGSSGQVFVAPQGNLYLQKVGFSGWGAVVNPLPASSTRKIALNSLIVQDGVHGLYSQEYADDRVLDYIEVTDSLFFNNSGFNVVYQGSVDAGLIAWNRFYGGTGRAVQIGKTFNSVGATSEAELEEKEAAVLAGQDAFRRIAVIGNIVKGLRNSAENSVICLIAYGHEMLFALNRIYDVQSSSNREIGGIYTKARMSTVIGNILRGLYHISGTGGDFYLNVKGSPRLPAPHSPEGYGTLVALNQLWMEGQGQHGIRVQNEETSLLGNRIDNPKTNAIYVSSGIIGEEDPDFDSVGYDRILIALNAIRGDHLDGTTGINCTTVGNHVQLLENPISGMDTGIRITADSQYPLAHYIERNPISGCKRAAIEADYHVPVHDLRILDNRIRDVINTETTAFGIILTPIASISNAEVRRNTITNIQSATGTGTAIYHGGPELSEFYSEDNVFHGVNVPLVPHLTAVLTGITSIDIDIPGTGYFPTGDNPVVITISGGGGTGARARGVASFGVLTQIIVTDPGSGYLTAPTVSINGGNGLADIDATAHANIPATTTAVAQIFVGDGGDYFTSQPTIVITPVSGVTVAIATANLVPVPLLGYNVTAGGTGYLLPPTIGFVGGGGSGASADAVISGGVLVGFTNVVLGTGYTSAPTITITPVSGGTGATAKAAFFSKIDSVTMNAVGTGYLQAPKITVTGGNANSGSGYGSRLIAPANNIRIEADHSFNIKTAPLQIDTVPTNRKGQMKGSAGKNFANLMNYAWESVDVTVTGCNVGDLVIGVSVVEGSPTGAWQPGLELHGEITAPNTVTVMMQNRSGAPRNLNTGTVYVVVQARDF